MITKKYVLVAKRGPLHKFKKERVKNRDWNQLWFPANAFPLGSLATSLECTLTTMSLVAAGIERHLGLAKNLGGNELKVLGIPFGASS